MRLRRFDDRLVVRLESGERVAERLVELLGDEDVGFADLSAAGAFRWVRLGYWDPTERTYHYRELTEQLEVVSFQGNAALRHGEPFLHIHVALGRADLTVAGEHLGEAVVHPTLEVWVRAEPVDVRRTEDPATGLDLLDLPPT